MLVFRQSDKTTHFMSQVKIFFFSDRADYDKLHDDQNKMAALQTGRKSFLSLIQFTAGIRGEDKCTTH